MRIGFFTDTYLPAVHGVEVSIETFRKTLEATGHQVFIYAPESPGYKDKNPNVFRFKSKRVIKKPEMRYAFSFLPVGHSFKEISHFKLDVVHAHTPFGLGLLAKYISERQLVPLIYTHHTHYPEYAKFYLKEKILLPYLAKVYSTWFANISDAIIAPSLKIKKLLWGYGTKKEIPIHILPTGIDLKIFKKSPKSGRQLRKKFKIPPKTKILISVSRVGKEKNVEFLIKAFAEILNPVRDSEGKEKAQKEHISNGVKKRDDVLLLIVGDGPFLEQLKKIAQNLKIAKSIIFTGRIPHGKIPAFYQSADIFLFASLTETQGIVILEALACGLPVVVLKDDAFAGVVIDGQNGFLVREQSPKLFAQKITNLLENPSLYKKFSIKAIKTAQNFSERSAAKKLIEIYKSQIGETNPVRSLPIL